MLWGHRWERLTRDWDVGLGLTEEVPPELGLGGE